MNIVILTGAGISAESGIATFRDQNGLWENHRVEDVATPEAFKRDPKLVQKFYNLRRAQLVSPEMKPNPGHEALARLEKEHLGSFVISTQNVDNLHERAGSQRVIHMHGELTKMFCTRSRKRFEILEDLHVHTACPCCHQQGTLRPDIVWFGEIPYEMERIQALCEQADLFISIGTSGNVYPAAGLSDLAEKALKIEVNADQTQVSHRFDKSIIGKAGETLPKLVDQILSGQNLV